MRSYPLIHVLDPSDDDAVILTVAMVPADEVGAFTAEVAHELGALLGLNREVALELFAVDVRDSVACPVPSRFELAPAMRVLFAREVAAVVRSALGLGAQAVAA